jgi:endonuclease III
VRPDDGGGSAVLPPAAIIRAMAKESAADRKQRALAIAQRLRKAQPHPVCELDHRSPWELLVATILAAQANDRTINEITPALFARFPTPAALAAADPGEVETMVKRSGFFRNKARMIQAASAMIASEFGGEVPRTMEALVRLPGVARKTANVVLGTAMRVTAGIIVDTHVTRVSQRLRLTAHEDPVDIEQDLCALLPKRSWIDDSHRFVLHGRYVCVARNPRCVSCPINELCPSSAHEPAGTWTQRAAWAQQLIESRGREDAIDLRSGAKAPEGKSSAARPRARGRGKDGVLRRRARDRTGPQDGSLT